MSYLTTVPAYSVLKTPGSPYRSHRDVMALFGDLPEQNPRQSAGILFRLEHDQRGTLLIRSNIKPTSQIEGLHTIEEADAPAEGTFVFFRLAVNAIRRQTINGKIVTKPVPLDSDLDTEHETISDFVARKLEGALTSVEVFTHHREVSKTGRSKDVTIQTDMVNGVAIVDSSEALAALLAEGVGRAKAYGCGLLTVRAMDQHA